MSATTAVGVSSTSVTAARAFWERLWRTSGFISFACFILTYLVYGHQPQIGAPADVLDAFYNGHRTRILIATFTFGNAVLFLLWFAAALRATLADAGEDGWGGAATVSSALVGGFFLLFMSMSAALAFSIAGSGDHGLVSGLNDLSWSTVVLSSYPRAMLIMAGSFGLWRAGLISNALFAAAVGAVVLVLLGGTTWMRAGIWAPDGAYSRIVSPLIGVVWLAVFSQVVSRSPATRSAW